MSGIFISYRREDSADICGRVYDHLIARYGKAAVFKDVDSIPYGESFPEYIQQKLAECSVCLAVIGPRWIDSASAEGRRRLDDPGDFVRIEIETALRLRLLVIPVLVNGAHAPPTEALPDSLAKLHTLNAAQVRLDPDFTTDVRRLGDVLNRYVPSPAAAATPARAVGTQSKPSPTGAGRRISPRSVLIGVLLLVAIGGSVALLPRLLASNVTSGYDVTGTWRLTETLPGGQTADHTLVLQETNGYKVTGTISASPNLALSLNEVSSVSEPQGVWRFDGQFQNSIGCESDFDATLSDSSHMVQGTFTPISYAGQCADFGAQFPPGAIFTATKTG